VERVGGPREIPKLVRILRGGECDGVGWGGKRVVVGRGKGGGVRRCEGDGGVTWYELQCVLVREVRWRQKNKKKEQAIRSSNNLKRHLIHLHKLQINACSALTCTRTCTDSRTDGRTHLCEIEELVLERVAVGKVSVENVLHSTGFNECIPEVRTSKQLVRGKPPKRRHVRECGWVDVGMCAHTPS
jgi:hypothetical protein